MQEQVLIAREKTRGFSSLRSIVQKYPQWQHTYPSELLLSASLCSLAGCLLYILPWRPPLQLLYSDNVGQNLLFLGILWVCFLGLFPLLFRLILWRQEKVNTQPAKARLFLRLLDDIAKIRLPLYIYGTLACLLMIGLLIKDSLLHHFQALPLGLISIFLFIVCWPYIRIFLIFLKQNIESLWQKFSPHASFEVMIASPNTDISAVLDEQADR